MELNLANIKNAKPGDILRDATIPGLHLKITPTRKSYMLYFRTKAGVERRPKLGDHGIITLDQARGMARKMLAKVAEGADPVFERNRERDAPTMGALWDRFWKDYGSRKKSAAEDKRIYEKLIQPKLGGMRLAHIRYEDIAKIHAGMADTPYMANRTIALLSKMFNFAYRPMQWLDDNPAKGINRYPEQKRKRIMKADEARKLAELLLAKYDTEPASVSFILLLIYCGCRKQDIANAKWSMLDGNVLRLPDSKTGSKDIYLPPQAMDVLAKLPKTNGTLTGVANPKKLWESLRTAAGCPDLRLHDLRRTFISAGLKAGYSLDMLGKTVEHASLQTTAGYAWLQTEVKAEVTNGTAALLEDMMR